MTNERPPHHVPGGFRNPWPTFVWPTRGAMLRWHRERTRGDLPPNPDPSAFPRAIPDPARPVASRGELAATWVGHSTWLLQIGGVNVLTDPHWSVRASPFARFGPARLTPPGIDFDALPPIDVVVLSHDHYDHLDDRTVRRLHARFGARIQWVTPLGFARWFGRRGIGVREMDWWDEEEIEGQGGTAVRVSCLPAQHWTSRTPFDRMRRLWASWSLSSPTHSLYFAGDSGWFPEYPRIGERAGPFDLVLMPIGAYEPRWFMRSSHMNPEEAVAAYRELGGAGVFGGMHWGTFRLTDEDPLEPPQRVRRAWADAALPSRSLWIPAHGETRRIAASGPVPSGGP